MSLFATLAWMGAAALLAAGLALLHWGVLSGRAKGRRRCPRCWYPLDATPSRRCPECGHESANDRELRRTRRRPLSIAAGAGLLMGSAALVGGQLLRTGFWPRLVPDLLLVELVEPWVPNASAGPLWRWQAMEELEQRELAGSLSDARRLRWAGRIASATGEPTVIARPAWPRWLQPVVVVDRRTTRVPPSASPWPGDTVHIHPVEGIPSHDLSPGALHVVPIDGFIAALAGGTLEVDIRRRIGGIGGGIFSGWGAGAGAAEIHLALATPRVSMTLTDQPVQATTSDPQESLASAFVVAVDREHAIAWINPAAPELDGGDVIVGGVLELLRDGEVVALCEDAIGAPHALPLRWVDPRAVSAGGSPRIGMPETIEWLSSSGHGHRVSPARGHWQVRLTGELRPALINELRRAADAPPGRPWAWATRWWAESVTIELMDAGLGRPALSPAALIWKPSGAAPSPAESSLGAFMRDRPGETRGLLFP